MRSNINRHLWKLEVASRLALQKLCGAQPSLRVIVTGLPRTGTSFLAGLVNRMGFSAGPEGWLKPADEHNRYGYFECVPLMQISDRVLSKLGGSFHQLPQFSPGWLDAFEAEKRQIRALVHAGNIEMFKGNRLVILADLYDQLFPEVKWIFIHRSVEETYQSRFGDDMSFEEWRRLSEARLQRWEASQPASRALYVDYNDFRENLKETIAVVEDHLEVVLTAEQRASCVEFYRPRR